jgi:hypothetical protein
MDVMGQILPTPLLLLLLHEFSLRRYMGEL